MTLADLRALCERATSLTMTFEENAGYDCVSSAYVLRDASGRARLRVDVADFLVPGEDTYEALHTEHPAARDLAELIAVARTWLPALIEVAEAAQKMNECVPGTSSFAKHFVAARKALARLDEVQG